ncbi:MAG: S9 family peptidase [Acidimicrobiales bacterium]
MTAAGTDAPVAAQDPVETVVWGRTLVDPYRWLHDKESEAVLAHLEAENRHTEAVLAPVAELREELYTEIKGRIKETDMSVPVVKDQWSYYTRTNEGDQYAIHCRRPAPQEGGRSGRSGGGPAPESPEGEPAVDEQILLDENLEAGDSEFFEVGLFDVSPDHRLLLWGADRTGDERFDAVVRDLETGEEFHDGLLDLSYGSAWALDNETFFYVRPDDANRPHEVWRHTVGQPVADDMLIFREDDERFFVGVARDKDDSYIHIGSSSKITDELRIVPADDPIAVPRLIAERRQGVEYSAAHIDDRFIILTNDGAEDFRVMIAPEDDPGPDNWTELIPEAPDVTISDIDVSAHFLVLFERTEGTTRIRLRSWRDGSFTTVDQPEEVSTTWPGANPDFNATTLRYGYTSMVTPPSVFLLDTESGERQLLKQQEVLGDFDPANYDTKREWATAKDGTRIPISLVWRKDAAALSGGPSQDAALSGGPRPCVLYAYGAYEASTDPAFSSVRLSLLDRGFCFAIAHVRGGGEMGRRWYLQGKFEKKQNTFGDVIAVAEHLLTTGWTSVDRLVLRGGSAGGLMAGAVVNQAPQLFAGVVAHVPFVDALNTILDPSQPLTVTEWEEWGNPTESEEIFEAMVAYSPYENVSEQPYPSIFATGGFHDTRVNYWEPAKWVQRLRERTTSDAPILLWTDLGAGHGGPSGRYEAWREEARILAYILWVVGLAR